MKKSKIFKLILLVLILTLAFLTIRDTYSRYITQTGNSSTLDISKWKILLNNEDIRNNSDFSEDIQIEYDRNDHIADGLIAPTSKGKFELALESTGTDLPFEYEIQITDPKPYEASLNGITFGDDTQPYLYEVSLDVTNILSNFPEWEMQIVVPNNIIEASSNFEIKNSTYNETYTVEDNILKINSSVELLKDSELSFKLIFAFADDINFEISNILINDTRLYNPTDRIADFRITSYTLNGVTRFVPAHASKITGEITPPPDLSEEVIQNFTFTVEWYDEDNNIYDNFDDVDAIKQRLPATIPITLSVTQILEDEP